MRGRAGLVATTLSALAVVAVAGLLGYRLAQHDGALPGRAPQDGISVAAQTATRTAFFGDHVTTSALVVLDTRRIDPRSVHPVGSFLPFKVVDTTTQTRRNGALVTQRTTWTLLCLDPGCLPGTQHAFSWTPLDVRYRVRHSGQQRELTVPFEPVTMLTRLAPHAARRPSFRVPRPVVAAPIYRIDPRAASLLLVAAGALLCLAGVALAAGLLVRARRRRVVAPDGFALVLGELHLAATGNGDSGRRRRALERLAELVEPLDRPLSSETRRLAWAPDDPPADAIDELARRAREAAQ